MQRKEVTLEIDQERLDKIDTTLLNNLKIASKAMGQAFMKQSYRKNEELLATITDEALREKIIDNAGPFERTNHNKPFIKGHTKPKGAGFYPENITKEEWSSYLEAHPEEKEGLISPYTLIERSEKGLVAIPYHEAYQKELSVAAKYLEQAATHTDNLSLKTFLNTRAQAFLTDNYYPSELLWMDLNGELEVTIGPYEVYEDELNGLKTTFEAFIGLVDEEETEKFRHYEEIAPTLEKDLPISSEYHNHERGTHSPISVVDAIYAAGDCVIGYHFTAYNLPNDERVREQKGSKKVMIHNVAKAKYKHCWIPIITELFEKEIMNHMTFEAYFTHVIMHEISHGLGPGKTILNGKETTVNAALKEAYTTIEEAKADLLGVYNAQVLAKRGEMSEEVATNILYAYIGGVFRSIRFGVNEAHGGANIIAYNHLVEQGGVVEGEKVVINLDLARTILTALITEILDIQAHGDYERATALIKNYCVVKDATQTLLERVKDVPVDIKPTYS